MSGMKRRWNGTYVCQESDPLDCTCRCRLREVDIDKYLDGVTPVPRAGLPAPDDGEQYCESCMLVIGYAETMVMRTHRDLQAEVTSLDPTKGDYQRIHYHLLMLHDLSDDIDEAIAPDGPRFYHEDVAAMVTSVGHHWSLLYRSWDGWLQLVRRLSAVRATDVLVKNAGRVVRDRYKGVTSRMRPCPRATCRVAWTTRNMEATHQRWDDIVINRHYLREGALD